MRKPRGVVVDQVNNNFLWGGVHPQNQGGGVVVVNNNSHPRDHEASSQCITKPVVVVHNNFIRGAGGLMASPRGELEVLGGSGGGEQQGF